MWSGEGVEGASAVAISHTALDGLVSRLFETSLTVTACRGLVDAPVAAKLGSVVDELDAMIRDVRQAVFDGYEPPSPGAAESS